MRPDDRIRLEHMLDAAQTAQKCVAGRVRSDLDSDRQLLFAVVRAVEINTETVWKTVTEELPRLVAALQTALNET